MGTLATVVFAFSIDAISSRPALEQPPPPPAPAPEAPFEVGCILFPFDEPVSVCPDHFPGLPPLELLEPCPDRIDEIIADAEGVTP